MKYIKPVLDYLDFIFNSTNSLIDIGQAEGAFVMGLGLFLFERPKYDPVTGSSITNGTWEYKVSVLNLNDLKLL